VNANKWMLETFDCSLHWFKNVKALIDCMRGKEEEEDSHSDKVASFRVNNLEGFYMIFTYMRYLVFEN
jgi:hypothetical protein